MSDTPKAPRIVLALAEQVHMTPIAWHVALDHVTIVFEQGQKLTFDRPSDPPATLPAAAPDRAPKPTRARSQHHAAERHPGNMGSQGKPRTPRK